MDGAAVKGPAPTSLLPTCTGVLGSGVTGDGVLQVVGVRRDAGQWVAARGAAAHCEGGLLVGRRGYVMASQLGRTGPLPDGFYGDLFAQQGRAILLVVFTGLLGFVIANLVRNTGAALGVGFVYFAVVENAVRIFRSSWQEWLLTDNAAALVLTGGHRIFIFGEGFVDEQGAFVDSGREVLLTNVHGGLVLGIATAVLVGLGVVLFARRDLH